MNHTTSVIIIVLSYWTVSISITFTNSYLLGDAKDSDISLFIPWFQCIVTAVAAYFISILRSHITGNKDQYPKFDNTTVLSKYLLLLGMNFSLVLTFNNLTLKHVGVAFFQVARSLTLVFTVILNYLILHKTTSLRTIGCCLIVICGFSLGIDQERLLGTLSISGACYGVMSSLIIAGNGILQKAVLEKVESDTFLFTLYENLNASIFFTIPLLITGQWETVLNLERAKTISFWVCLSGSGLLGLLIAWVIALHMDRTSPLTCNISTNTKSALQTVIAIAATQKTKPLFWWMSNVLVISGASLYTYVRYHENQAAKMETPPLPSYEPSKPKQNGNTSVVQVR